MAEIRIEGLVDVPSDAYWRIEQEGSWPLLCLYVPGYPKTSVPVDSLDDATLVRASRIVKENYISNARRTQFIKDGYININPKKNAVDNG